ncbi:MAG: PmoA family protein [Opitutus sp.]
MIELKHEPDRAEVLWWEGRVLCRYVYRSDAPEVEAPRPYFHPLNSLSGETLTNFRPNDHPWHHGLSMTLNNVSGTNFWGGPTCLRGQGYQLLKNQGTQHHVAWRRLEVSRDTANFEQTLAWKREDDVLLTESRTITIAVNAPEKSWSLRWISQLTNVSGRVLSMGNPHSTAGLAGSHYTGLAFRGARELLDDHLDPTIKIIADGNREGVAAVHGASARWMEWHGQLDTTLQRVKIRFESNSGPVHWFVRRPAPLMAFPFQFDQNLEVPPGDKLERDHTLTFTEV